MKLKLRAAAKALIAHEAQMLASPTAAPFGGAIEKLRSPLSALAGASGFSSLLLRALAIARPEAPWLSSIEIDASGAIDLAKAKPAIASEIAEGEIALVAALLELLVTFIGELLTLRLLRDAWPKLPFNTLKFENEAP